MKDYIIVGAGLSGSCLAYRLQKRRKSFVVFDDKSQKASRVAGGLINPVVLKRFTLALKADEQLAIARKFYSDMESDLGKKFLRPLEVYRRFSSVEEQNNWFSAADNKRLAPFLDTKLVSHVNDHISGKYSFGKVLNTFRIDLRNLLDCYLSYLQENGWFQNDTFEYGKLSISESEVEYKGLKAKKIIFCEGFGLLKNPYFNYLPMIGNKGEYIHIKAPGLNLDVSVKSSVFIIPEGEDHYLVGATYNNTDKNQGTTKAAREELVEKLRGLIRVEFEIVDQVAGLRPTTVDRKPLAGRHPRYSNLYTCNGFGSRGILLAPTISKQLLNFIEEGQPMDPETDIARFTKKWFKEA